MTQEPPAELTRTEEEMIRLAREGYTITQIAKRLQLIPKGVMIRLARLRSWGYLPDQEGRS